MNMKYAEKNLALDVASLRDQFLSIVEKGKVIFLIVDEVGKIEYITTYVEDILHFKQKDLIGSNIFEIIEPNSVANFRSLITGVRSNTNKAVHFEDIGLHCSYCLRHYFDGLVLEKNSKEGRKFAFYLHDVTDRRMDAEKLAVLNLELDSFIYKASHDLRSPLLSITGLLNLMEKSSHFELTEYTQLMKRSTERLTKYITQLAHYSRNNNAEIDNSKINFKHLFEEVIENYKFLPNAEKIRFYVETEDMIETCSDSFRLKIILNNIVSNAIKYHDTTQIYPFVRLAVKGDEKSFYIKVTDNGVGIVEESIDNIFGMFKRATDRADGSGLGLYIVKKALEKMGGTISVSSKIGIGTTFTIALTNGAGECGIPLQYKNT
jgi:PAS domain S-box-containing protein